MMDKGPEALRPLSFGEIFDRAVTLYVRNFVQFSVILLLVVVPVAILEYFGDRTSGANLHQVMAQISRARAGLPAPAPQPGILWALLLTLLISPIANVAIAMGVARAYFGQPFTWKQCYAAAASRWAPILGLTAVAAVLFFISIFAGAFGLTLLAIVAYLAFKALPVAGIALAVLAIAASLAFVAAVVLLLITVGFAYYAIGIEGAGVFDALGGGLARVFNRREIGRALLLALSLAAIEIGAILIFAVIVALASSVVYSRIMILAANAAVSIFTSAFSAVLLAVYYFDVRVRREGLDLQASLDALAGERPAPA